MSGIKYLYQRIDFAQLELRTAIIRNNALHDLTLITMIVARFVITRVFLNTYSTERIANLRSSSIIKKIITLIKKLSNLQSSHYRNATTDPKGSTEHTLGTANIEDSSHVNDTIGNVRIT